MTRVHRVRLFSAPWLTSLLTVTLCFVASAGLRAQGYDSRSYDSPPSSSWEPLDDRTYDTDWSDDVPAHIAVVDGSAWHDREGVAEGAEQNVALLAGDRLRTQRGRVEVLFADGSALDLDEGTDVELLSDSLLRLNSGRIRLHFVRSADRIDYRVDAAGTTTWIRSAGEYRITVRGATSVNPEVRLAVLRGVAELGSAYGRTIVQAGYEAVSSGRMAPSRPYYVNATTWDSFDRWVEARLNERNGYGYQSAQYLPEEIRYYSHTLDRYGSWSHDRTYGYVWYPRVAVDWRPYYDGRWSFVGSFGWFWVGATNWSWPTHHYGRWGANAGRWYWIPDRRWAPAWVSWASAPGYVSWSPLGWDNRPVYHLSVSTYDSWRGWTVAPSRGFANNIHVRRYAINGRTAVPRDVRFVERQQAPVRPSTIRGNERPLRAPTLAARTRVAQPSSTRTVDSRPVTGVGSTNGRTIAPRTDAGAAAGGRVVQRGPATTEPSSGTAGPSRTYRSPGAAAPATASRPSVAEPNARVRTAPGRIEREPVEPAPSAASGPAAGQAWGRTARPRVEPREAPPGARSVERPREAVEGPRSSAPERRIDSRPIRGAERSQPAPSAPAERAAPPSRSAPENRAPRAEPRSRGESDSGPRPGANAPASRPEPGSTNGRTAPSGGGSGERARGRS